MKKVLISLFVIVVLITITGCKKGTESSSNSQVVAKGPSCKKESDSQTIEYVTVLDNDELKSFNIISTYEYTNLDSLKSSCTNNKKEEKDVNAKNIYVKYKVTCDENNKKITIEKDYDVKKSLNESSIKNMLSYVFKYIKDDNKFDLDGWKQSNIKDGFTCK